MPKHVLWIDGAETRGSTLVFTGDEARHAMRVKRLKPGEEVLGLDGLGALVRGRVVSTGRELTVEVLATEEAPRVAPAIEVWAPMPKGTRSGDLIDMLTQVGARGWVPMTTNRSVSDLTGAKRARLERVAAEACKQSRRAWMLEIGGEQSFEQALDAGGARLVIAEQSGASCADVAHPDPAVPIRLLIGPEGGFTGEELERARVAGAVACSFGPHVQRIEVAAAVGCAILLGAHR